MTEHLNVVHLGEPAYQFTCNFVGCGKIFSRKSHLYRHSFLHYPNKQKPHKCPYCDSSYTVASDLERHKRTVSITTKL